MKQTSFAQLLCAAIISGWLLVSGEKAQAWQDAIGIVVVPQAVRRTGPTQSPGRSSAGSAAFGGAEVSPKKVLVFFEAGWGFKGVYKV
jgi:hypothetical protein